jgi:hypothetical protein
MEEADIQVLLVCLCIWLSRQPSAPVVNPTAAEVAPIAGMRKSSALVTPAIPVVPRSPAAASSPSRSISLAQQVDQWARSGDSHQAKQAYEAIAQCLMAPRRARSPEPLAEYETAPDAASAGGDLRSDQVQHRIALLESAAKAGETGAALGFIQEGPSGNGLLQDLGTTDPTPPTADWLSRRDAYIELGLRHCDLWLATYLGWFVRQRETRSQAATQYWRGRVACPGQPAANTTPLADDPDGQANLDALVINGWRQ